MKTKNLSRKAVIRIKGPEGPEGPEKGVTATRVERLGRKIGKPLNDLMVIVTITTRAREPPGCRFQTVWNLQLVSTSATFRAGVS